VITSLCQVCSHCQEVISGRGSVFYLCRQSQTDSRYPKYPPQPVVRCVAFATKPAETMEEPAGD